MKLSNESKTMFIPLYGKALMSKKNIFIKDKKAEEIIESIDYNFNKLKQSKWLSMYMALRSSIIDNICNKYIDNKTTIIHLGCGLDSRCLRVNNNYGMWYDIDFKSVIDIRKKYYTENNKYKMIGKSVLDFSWLDEVNISSNTLIIMEGLTMYLSEEELSKLLNNIYIKIGNTTLIFDAYSKKAVKLSKYKNPVKQMKASIKWGMDTKDDFSKLNNNLKFCKEYLIKGNSDNLKGITKYIFNNVYSGKHSESLYKIYEYKLID